MSPKPFVVTPKDYDRALNIVGEQQRGPEGAGPPPHAHDWDESFFVTKGEIEFGIADEKMTASPGTLVHLPAGVMHWFRFCAGGGEMISMTSRLGASKMFADMDRELAPVNPDLAKLAEVAGRHGLKLGI